MGETDFYDWPYPDPGSTVDVPRDIKALAERLETIKNGLQIPAGNITAGDVGGAGNFGYVIERNTPVGPYDFRWGIDDAGNVRYTFMKNGATLNAGIVVNQDGTISQWNGTGAAAFRPVPFATATNLVSGGSFGANAGVSLAVTFPAGRFTLAPAVIALGVSSGSYVFATGTGVSTTGTTIKLYNPTATGVVSSLAYWFAVQMAPTNSFSPASRAAELNAQIAQADNATATCHTAGCGNDNEPIPVHLDDDDIRVSCGVCAQWIDDVTSN